MFHQSCSLKQPPGKASYTITEKVANILKMTNGLSQEEYYALTMEVLKNTPCTEMQQNTAKNFIVDKLSKWRKGKSGGQVREEKERPGSRQPHPVDLGPGPSSSFPSPAPLPSFPKVNFIYRGDLVAKSKKVAFDVEKIELKETHQQRASTLAVVNEKGKLILWCIFKYENVCKYYTNLTGITKDIMNNGISLEDATPYIKACMKEKTVVGTEILSDLESLGLKPNDIEGKLEDIQKFFIDKNKQKISIAALTMHFYGVDRQSMHGNHSAIIDARLTMMCDKRKTRMQLSQPQCFKFVCPMFDEEREQSKMTKKGKPFNNWEKCTCGYKKQKGKKTHVFDQIGSFSKTHPDLFADLDRWEFGGTNMAQNEQWDWE